MTIELELQLASKAKTLPHPSQFREWIGNTLRNKVDNVELTIRIVDEPEMSELNSTFRKKSGPTNVLSFPYEKTQDFDSDLLGDIVICAPVVQKEANDANIDLLARWAHMVVHGALHLIGYDHMQEAEASEMEELETQILGNMGFAAPYHDRELHD